MKTIKAVQTVGVVFLGMVLSNSRVAGLPDGQAASLDRIVHELPISIEGQQIAVDFYVSFKTRRISAEGEPAYRIRKGQSGVEKATNRFEKVAAQLIDAVFDDNPDQYRQLTTRIDRQDGSKENSIAEFETLKYVLLNFADNIYPLNEFVLPGLNVYEYRLVPTTQAKADGRIVKGQTDGLYRPMVLTDSDVEHRPGVSGHPIMQSLVASRKFARERSAAEITKIPEGYVKFSYEQPLSADTILPPVSVDYYFKAIRPAGESLVFRRGQLHKDDFEKETHDLWRFYADMLEDLAAIPEVDEFQLSPEYKKYISRYSDESAKRLNGTFDFQAELMQRYQSSETPADSIKAYKRMRLVHRDIAFAIDADPVFFVFDTRVSMPTDSFGTIAVLRDENGYKIVNDGYVTFINGLFLTEEFKRQFFELHGKMTGRDETVMPYRH